MKIKQTAPNKYTAELSFPWNYIVGIPIVCIVFTFVGAIFLAISALLLSPFIFLVWFIFLR